MKLILSVDVPPSLNHLYATVKGHRTLSARGRSYKKDTGWIIKQEALQQAWEGGERYSLTMRLWFKSRQRRDLSNTIKVLEDSLSEALGFDDTCIDRLVVERVGVDKERPRCEVELEVLS